MVTCVRSDKYGIRYFFQKLGPAIEKIGQFLSLADIENDEVVQYRLTMDRNDAHEFHKAIGLAAHGVGVGSFVYLRRVFERLIYSRFEKYKEAEGWADAQFYPGRMEDKVMLLNGHLPEFLVENRKIYSILSVGLHELDKKTCLHWFMVIKQSIPIILEDDKKKNCNEGRIFPTQSLGLKLNVIERIPQQIPQHSNFDQMLSSHYFR